MKNTEYTIDPSLTKVEKYKHLYQQAEALVADESNSLANMSNLCALVHHTFGFWWTGFYLIENETLVLGPFQGPIACTRINYGKGVCGTSWERGEPIVVPNVHEFDGHIACSSATNSEIVLPVYNKGKIIGVFDVDGTEFNTFDETDVIYLQKVLSLIAK